MKVLCGGEASCYVLCTVTHKEDDMSGTFATHEDKKMHTIF